MSVDALAAYHAGRVKKLAGETEWPPSATEDELHAAGLEAVADAARLDATEALAKEAFADKSIQGLRRVLIGNWLRGRAARG